ncbi:putative disease resistance protein At3g14460 [Medicago truncatula]|uniref:putative disease resistance protein At3g14460 n=1 Tax=Medicago truncatula TaxID=3880 RepID=UPI000D2F1DEA|nr:putative disease resistance protein At3g14460 [Medicago truncatula]
MDRLIDLSKMKDNLGLTRRNTWTESLHGLVSCSVVLDNYFYGNYPKDYFYGREQEEKYVFDILLSTTSEQNVKVINIEGKSGAVKVSFIAKKILEAVTEEFVSGNDLHELTMKLKESFQRKKFLLVLDDIRIEHDDESENWNMLVDSLFEAATAGSAIIFTSNPDDSLLVPHANHTFHLEIVNRLGNLPLAAKMIGSLLQDKVHLSEWVDVLRSKLIDEGYEFKQKEVVLLWMAQGFLQNSNTKSNHKSIEDIGDEYFGYLVMRSFLQPFGSGLSFTMHNLVHDLATYVFGESYNHHLSYSRSTHAFPESFVDTKRKLLRTILPVCLPLERAPSHIDPFALEESIKYRLNPHIFLTLSLSHYDITYLPNSIGRLSNLCYLDLSHTALETLPDSICDLCNLQTLMLTNCRSLTSFPPRICNLINLRCLDIRDSGVQEMPLEMEKVTSLRTLP